MAVPAACRPIFRRASLVSVATCRPRVSLISIAAVVILNISSLNPRICLYAQYPSPPSFGRQYPPIPGPGNMILLCVGRTLMALMTLIRSTPLRSANKLHSSRNANIVARKEFSTILVVSDSMGRSITVRGNSSVFSTSLRNFSTRSLACSLQPEQTRQKSRIDDT